MFGCECVLMSFSQCYFHRISLPSLSIVRSNGYQCFCLCCVVRNFTFKCDECGQSWMTKHNDANPKYKRKLKTMLCVLVRLFNVVRWCVWYRETRMTGVTQSPRVCVHTLKSNARKSEWVVFLWYLKRCPEVFAKRKLWKHPNENRSTLHLHTKF